MDLWSRSTPSIAYAEEVNSDLLDLDITGIAHGGVFVARHEGRVVFVSDAIPGERVRARLTDPATGSEADTRSFWRAETVEVLGASPHRRPHVWPAADVTHAPADRPGGADLGHIELAHQRVLKHQVLAEALDRFAGGGLEAPEVSVLDESDGTGWRTRVTLHANAEGRIGPFAARSHRVIETPDLPLARPAIADAARVLGTAEPGRVTLVEPGDGRVRVIPQPEKGRQPKPEVVWEEVRERRFAVDAGGFWQVHPHAATTLDEAVRELLDGRVERGSAHLDLYGGVGLFAATLSDLGARRVTTVESSKRATAHAAANLTKAPARVQAVTARVDRFLSKMESDAARDFSGGAVVLDPPRSGAGRRVVEAVVALHPSAIVYVACDPVALARDLKTFRGLGWEPAALRAYDLFPHSHHFETVALLTR